MSGDINFTDIVSNNSVLGASLAATLAMLYKVWQILKRDRKEDNLDNAERSLRDELRQELSQLRTINEKLREENAQLHNEIAELKASFRLCQSSRPPSCPIFNLLANQNGNRHE